MIPKETIILFDFDNTLFKTKEFWREALFPAYAELGLLLGEVEKTFTTATSLSIDYFIPEVFLDEMQRSFPNTSQADLKRVFESVVYSEKAKEFFFPNALDAVALASKKGYRKLLLSYGDVAYKTRFFTYCGIDAHFSPEEIVITNEKKNDMVATLPLEPSVIIVNDVADETRGMITALQDSGHKVKAFLFAPDPEVSLDGLESFFSFSTLQHSL